MRRLRRQAPQGVLPGRDRVQGLGLLPHGQPEQLGRRGTADKKDKQPAESSAKSGESSNGSADKADKADKTAAKKSEPVSTSAKSSGEKVA